jgi:ATP-dependent phosphofructokinase / diphosphate-dependent phosphofructokinase
VSATLGILVGGGPAPGINSAIASAAIEAINNGCRVIGILDGFKWLAAGDHSHVMPLRIEDVSRIHWTGGSVLRTSRTNPAHTEEALARAVSGLAHHGVTHLLCIGGDGTTSSAARVVAASNSKLRVATIPKTIDNDLPLPDNMPTFGFETARAVGAGIIESLMEDARTMSRWYIVISMGRKSGALALGICKASGATLAVIPEEFKNPQAPFNLVSDTIAGAIVKRRSMGSDHGVAIVAEGVCEMLDTVDHEHFKDAPRDAFGRLRMSEMGLGNAIKLAVDARLRELGLDVGVVTKDIGYELRCAKPVPFDVEYTRTLGYGAVRYLLNGGSGAMLALRGGNVVPVTFEELTDPATGAIGVRLVDTSTESYEVGRKYMIRLEPSDLHEPKLSELAAATRLSADALRRLFSPVVISAG